MIWYWHIYYLTIANSFQVHYVHKTKSTNMKGIYREVLRPEHVVKVLQRDEESIAYEDGGKIVCTKRIKSFDQKFVKDDNATVAEIVADFIPAIR
jgi:hypothetical protein